MHFTGNMLCAHIRPIVLFKGRRIAGRNGLTIQEGKKRTLEYRIERSLLGLGKNVLKVNADRAITLPELELMVSENNLLKEWPEQPTDANGKIEISLDENWFKFKSEVALLKLKHQQDANWIKIEHPPEAKRRITA